jgi:hypothetical protein
MESLLLALSTWFVYLVTGVLLVVSCTSQSTTSTPWLTNKIDPSSTSTPCNSFKQTATIYLPTLTQAATIQITSPSFEDIVPTPADPVQLAMSDLAGRLQVGKNDIQVINVYPDEFPASDLGYPQSGITPLPQPAFVSGKVFELEYGGLIYIYHVRGKLATYCGYTQ